MGVDAELRDEMISLYNQHVMCDVTYTHDDCCVGTEFMEYMKGFINAR